MAALAKEYRVYISEWARVPEGRPSLRRHAGDRGGLLRPLSRGTLWLRLTSFSLTRFASPTSVPSRTTLCADCQGRERDPPLRKDTAVAHRAPDYVFVTCCLLLCGNNRNSQSIDRSINQSHLKALFSSSSDLYFSCLFISTAFGETKVF